MLPFFLSAKRKPQNRMHIGSHRYPGTAASRSSTNRSTGQPVRPSSMCHRDPRAASTKSWAESCC
eukprot:1331808-Rhodomonas_salina.1